MALSKLAIEGQVDWSVGQKRTRSGTTRSGSVVLRVVGAQQQPQEQQEQPAVRAGALPALACSTSGGPPEEHKERPAAHQQAARNPVCDFCDKPCPDERTAACDHCGCITCSDCAHEVFDSPPECACANCGWNDTGRKRQRRR